MTSSPEVARRGVRRSYLDWARGIAVLIMIEAHILDAWTLPAARHTRTFDYLNILGGFAAPLFLWLAGLSMVLAAERTRLRTGDRAAAGSSVFRRGAEVFALAFLFRVQAFVISPGNPLVSLLRVDILNIMGPSLMAAAVVWRLAPDARRVALVSGLVTVAIAMVTPIVRGAGWLTLLPPFLQWYLSPVGNHSTFTLFPWSAFVFAGAAYGALLGLTDPQRQAKPIAWLAVGGVLLAAGSYYASTRPSIYAVSSFWTSSPTYFGVRVGLLMALVGLLFAVAPLAAHVTRPFAIVERFGRNSLFVYWIHVELVYGYATFLIHRRLPLWGMGVGFVIFTAAMYRAIDLRDWLVVRWRARSAARPVPESAGA